MVTKVTFDFIKLIGSRRVKINNKEGIRVNFRQ